MSAIRNFFSDKLNVRLVFYVVLFVLYFANYYVPLDLPPFLVELLDPQAILAVLLGYAGIENAARLRAARASN